MNSREPQTDPDSRKTGKRTSYEAPKVLASYEKEELEAAVQPEGGGSGGGCGPGCSG